MPHPRPAERRFALEPLAELSAGAVVPGRAPSSSCCFARRRSPGPTGIHWRNEPSGRARRVRGGAGAPAQARVHGRLSALPVLRAHAGRDVLCDELDLKVVPQASYPFFHAQMEDVWVWDKNRPTRIIPRAEVYTSGDVTVEELRGEGDEPTSHRRGARRAARREYVARTTTTPSLTCFDKRASRGARCRAIDPACGTADP